MTILVANVGSSSYKCRLLEMPSERDLAGAEVERVGASDAIVTSRRGDAVLLDRHVEPVPDHLVGVFEPGFLRRHSQEARIFGLPYGWYHELTGRAIGYRSTSRLDSCAPGTPGAHPA